MSAICNAKCNTFVQCSALKKICKKNKKYANRIKKHIDKRVLQIAFK